MRVFLFNMIQFSDNEQVFLKQFDSWDLTEKQRQEVYKNLLIADEKAMEEADGQIVLYEKRLEILEELVQKWFALTPEQATDIKTEGLIKGWADLFNKKEEKTSTFLSRFLSCLTNIKEKFL